MSTLTQTCMDTGSILHYLFRLIWNGLSDTYFSSVPGATGVACAQLYACLASHMMNVYPMMAKTGVNVLATYHDCMQEEGLPMCLHPDLTPEQKTPEIIEENRKMQVKYSWAEEGHHNQNPVENLAQRAQTDHSESCGFWWHRLAWSRQIGMVLPMIFYTTWTNTFIRSFIISVTNPQYPHTNEKAEFGSAQLNM